MARFGRDLVRSLTQPAYLEGLSRVGMLAGSLPDRQEKARKTAALEKSLFGLEQMALAGDLTPEMYKEATGSFASLIQQNPDQADKIRKSLSSVGASVREQTKTEKEVKVKRDISNLRNAALAVESSNLSPEQKKATLAKMRLELKKIQDANPTLDLTQYDGMFEDVVTEARAARKTAELDAKQAYNEKISQQIFQIKDLKTLESTAETLLAAEGANAEAIKKYVSLQQSSILDKKERKRIEEENSYDMTTNVEDIRKRLDGLPPEVAEMVNAKLSRAEESQLKYRKNETWTNTKARNEASKLIDAAVADIERYQMTKLVQDQRLITSLEAEIADITAEGVPSVNTLEVNRVAEAIAMREKGEDLEDLKPKERQKIYDRALKEETERVRSEYNNRLSAKKRQLSALRGEDIEEEEETTVEEETPKFLNPISKEAVSAARARGQTDKQIIDSLKALGATNDQIVNLL